MKQDSIRTLPPKDVLACLLFVAFAFTDICSRLSMSLLTSLASNPNVKNTGTMPKPFRPPVVLLEKRPRKRTKSNKRSSLQKLATRKRPCGRRSG